MRRPSRSPWLPTALHLAAALIGFKCQVLEAVEWARSWDRGPVGNQLAARHRTRGGSLAHGQGASVFPATLRSCPGREAGEDGDERGFGRLPGDTPASQGRYH